MNYMLCVVCGCYFDDEWFSAAVAFVFFDRAFIIAQFLAIIVENISSWQADNIENIEWESGDGSIIIPIGWTDLVRNLLLHSEKWLPKHGEQNACRTS